MGSDSVVIGAPEQNYDEESSGDVWDQMGQSEPWHASGMLGRVGPSGAKGASACKWHAGKKECLHLSTKSTVVEQVRQTWLQACDRVVACYRRTKRFRTNR